MKVSREVLLNKLETVQPGISPKEIIDQSGCFVFKDGEVMTYNDEVSCRQKVDLKIEGAVTAAPLLAILRKLTEDVVDIHVLKYGCELRIKGKKKQASIRMEAEIRLEIDVVERHKKWKKLHEDFAEAIHIVGQCVGTDESKPTTTCIHIHPEWVEASDNYQVSQFKMKTGVKTSCLVKQTSLKHIVSLGMTKFSETESWFHFKNPNGLIVSCRRYVEEFGDTAAILAVKGTPTVLPKGLAEAVDKAASFSSEPDENQVLIELRPGKLRLRAVVTLGR